MARHPRRGQRGFTLIEILIVVVILGLLATLVVAKFRGVADDAEESAIKMQLRRVRTQIEYFRGQQGIDPDLIDTQWDDLVDNNYLQQAPVNSFNGSTVVAPEAAVGVGWVWRDPGSGTFDLFATDQTMTTEWPG